MIKGVIKGLAAFLLTIGAVSAAGISFNAEAFDRSKISIEEAKGLSFPERARGSYYYNVMLGSCDNCTEMRAYYDKLFEAYAAFWNSDRDVTSTEYGQFDMITYDPGKLSNEDRNYARWCFRQDNIGWLGGCYAGVSEYVRNGVGYAEPCVTEACYTAEGRLIQQQKVEEFMKSYDSCMDDSLWITAKNVHDKLCKDVDYAFDKNGNPLINDFTESILGAINDKKLVCGGYSNTFLALASYCGVETIVISGDTSSGPHAWNAVRVDNGKIYFIDCTWDDDYTAGSVYNDCVLYKYFLIGSDNFEKDHTPEYKTTTSSLKLILPDEDTKDFVFPSTGMVKNGWSKQNGVWYYYDDFEKVCNGEFCDGGKWYKTKADGTLYSGWYIYHPYEICPTYYYYYDPVSGARVTGWKKINGGWYHFDSEGRATLDSEKIDGKWYSFDSNGRMKTGWVICTMGSDKYYRYYTPGGPMAIGWYKYGKSWYYFGSDGAMRTSWQKISGKWYYFNSKGEMLSGWQKISIDWYYFGTDGAMRTGWTKVGSAWYYFNAGGDMVTGWKKIGTKWYYFESSGAMRTKALTEKGKTYYFNSDGSCKNP